MENVEWVHFSHAYCDYLFMRHSKVNLQKTKRKQGSLISVQANRKKKVLHTHLNNRIKLPTPNKMFKKSHAFELTLLVRRHLYIVYMHIAH